MCYDVSFVVYIFWRSHHDIAVFFLLECFFWGTAKATQRRLFCRCATCRKSNTFRSYPWVSHSCSTTIEWFSWPSLSSCLQMDNEGEVLLSLDDGHTRFTDLIQLVEFYQLNCGVLPCKLKHHCTKITLWAWDHQRSLTGWTLPVYLCLNTNRQKNTTTWLKTLFRKNKMLQELTVFICCQWRILTLFYVKPPMLLLNCVLSQSIQVYFIKQMMVFLIESLRKCVSQNEKSHAEVLHCIRYIFD